MYVTLLKPVLRLHVLAGCSGGQALEPCPDPAVGSQSQSEVSHLTLDRCLDITPRALNAQEAVASQVHYAQESTWSQCNHYKYTCTTNAKCGDCSKQETADLQAALQSLQAEIDRLHHEKQQQQPPINYVSDLNAAAARYITPKVLCFAFESILAMHPACIAVIQTFTYVY